MTKARLVKREEVLERKQAARASAVPVSATRVNIHSMIQRFNRRQSMRPSNPRETFAALFVRPQTS